MKFENKYGYVKYEQYEEVEEDSDGEETITDSYTLMGLIFISKEYRGKGKGGVLLDSFLKTLKDDCVLSIDSKGDMSNEQLIEFYKKHGFAVQDTDADLVLMRHFH